MTLLAGVLIETGRYDEALALAADAKALYVKSLGPNHWRTASAANAEGAALAGLKQYEQAQPLLEESRITLQADSAAPRYYVKSSGRWLAKLQQQAPKHLAQSTRVK